VKVCTNTGTYRCNVLVGADGAGSTAARDVGLANGCENGIGVETTVAMEAHHAWKWDGLFLLDYGGISGGYGWIFPKKTCLSVGAGGPSGSARTLKPYLNSLLNASGFDASRQRIQGHFMPVRRNGTPLTTRRALLVGDAAGMIDPVTGEGLYFGLKSSLLACKPIRRLLEGKAADLSEYETAVDRELMPEINIARSLQKITTVNPRLLFRLLKENDRCWNAYCRVLRGEKTYSEIKQALGPFARVFDML
jgi:flavin-dependent dehydrogenase